MAMVRTGNETMGMHRDPNWEPLQLMRRLVGWDPFQEMAPSGWNAAAAAAGFGPAFDVHEEADAYVFVADMPGVRDKDLDVQVTGNRLTISGKREGSAQGEASRVFLSERGFGSFSRAFTLPDGVAADGVEAKLDHGVLALRVPKRAEAQPRRISVTRSS